METGFAYFFDILTIVVIVSAIYMCGKQGFVKSIITLVGYSLAVIISVFAGNTLAPKIYDSAVKPEIISVVNEQLGSADVPYEITHALNNKYGKYGVKFEKSDVIITGIEKTNTNATDNDAKWYDTSGRHITHPTNGLFINDRGEKRVK